MDIESYSSFYIPALLFIMDLLRETTNIEQQSFLPYIIILILWDDSWGQLGNFVKKWFNWLDTFLLSN